MDEGLRKPDVRGNLAVGCRAVQGDGMPKVELVKDIEDHGVMLGLLSAFRQ